MFVKFIENYGAGIQRIIEGYQDTKYQVEFYVSNGYFMITLHSLNPIEAYDAQNDAQNDAKNDANDAKTQSQKTLEEQVAELIRDNNSISKIEMSKKQKVKIYYRENVKTIKSYRSYWIKKWWTLGNS